MSYRILIADGLDSSSFKKLSLIDQFDLPDSPKLELDQLNKLIENADALVVRSKTIVNEELLSRATNLKIVIRAGEGLDNIDGSACKKRDIAVFNTPGANGLSAAEHAISLIFASLRFTSKADSSMQSGSWDKNKFTGFELTGKSLGILGLGRIGAMLSQKLSGFDLQQYYFDPLVPQDKVQDAQSINTVEELFTKSNIITIHTPLLPQTKNLVSYELLKLMPKPSFLINAARGPIVCIPGLVKALDEGILTGAALDVFPDEPLEKNSPLRGRDNVVLTPHIGASTQEAQFRVGEMVVEKLKEFFKVNVCKL